jgi:hypothetical protein
MSTNARHRPARSTLALIDGTRTATRALQPAMSPSGTSAPSGGPQTSTRVPQPATSASDTSAPSGDPRASTTHARHRAPHTAMSPALIGGTR